MMKAITQLIIASAGLWLALPAAAQFEIDPDHFDEPAMTVVQPRPEQSKGSTKISLPNKQVQKQHVGAVRGTTNPASTRTLSSPVTAQRRRVSGTNRVARGHADRKPSKQSGLVLPPQPYGLVPQ